MDENINIKKYIIIFSISYIFIVILLIVMEIVLGISSSGVTILIVSLSGASIFTIQIFLQQNNRIPNKLEKRKLVYSSLLIGFLIPQIYGIIIYFDNITIIGITSVGVVT